MILLFGIHFGAHFFDQATTPTAAGVTPKGRLSLRLPMLTLQKCMTRNDKYKTFPVQADTLGRLSLRIPLLIAKVHETFLGKLFSASDQDMNSISELIIILMGWERLIVFNRNLNRLVATILDC